MILRALEPTDLELLYMIENKTDEWSVSSTTVPYSRAVLQEYLRTQSNDIYADKQVRFVIDYDGCAVGFADLQNFDALNLRAEVGLVIMPEYRGRGLATEALELLADYAHNTIHLHQLYAIVAASNQASLRLFEKTGYNKSAILADWLNLGTHYDNAILFTKIL